MPGPLILTVIVITPQDGYTTIEVLCSSSDPQMMTTGGQFTMQVSDEIAALNSVGNPMVWSA